LRYASHLTDAEWGLMSGISAAALKIRAPTSICAKREAAFGSGSMVAVAGGAAQ